MTTHSSDQLKDYFCPFCNNKLFRGKVNEFRLVCLECNKLVDSRKLSRNQEEKGTPLENPPETPSNQPEDRSELAE